MSTTRAAPLSEETAGTGREILELLQDAAALRLVAAAFAYPDAAQRERVRQAFAEIVRTQSARLGSAAWSPAFERARTLYARAGEETEGEHVRLFLGSAAVPLHESAWGDGRRMGGRTAELADVAGFYRAFRFALSSERRDLPDHLCAELEFAAALLIKEAYALGRNRDEDRDIARAALADFLDSHLGRWTRAVLEGLSKSNASELYEALGLLAVELVGQVCTRLGVAPELAEGRFPSEEPDCLSCPMAAREQKG